MTSSDIAEGMGVLIPTSDRWTKILRHWVTTAILALVDALAFISAAVMFRAGHPQLNVVVFSPGALDTQLNVFTILGVIFVISRYISGDYSQRRFLWNDIKATTLMLFLIGLPCIVVVVAFDGQYSQYSELACWIYLIVAIPTFRQFARMAMNKVGLWGLPTALIASCERAEETYAALSSRISMGCDIRWLALEDAGSGSPDMSKKLKVLTLKDGKDLSEKLVQEGCFQAIVATDDVQSRSFADLIQRLMEAKIEVLFIPSFRRLPLVGSSTSLFLGKDLLLFQIRRRLQRRPNRILKRMFDIVGSVGLLTLFSPVFLLVALAIKLHDGGRVFYSQVRVGLDGRQFRCHKFRSMASNADERLERWKIEAPEMYEEFLKTYKLLDDPRVTRPGKWLRRSSLDELPQLFNVLCGDMSIVGPRPIPEQQLREQYGAAARLYMTVRPGLTGLWQISGRNDTSLEDRVNYDEWYILNWSFWYDLVIIIQTAGIVLTRRGAY